MIKIILVILACSLLLNAQNADSLKSEEEINIELTLQEAEQISENIQKRLN